MNASGSVPACARSSMTCTKNVMNGGFATNTMSSLYDHAKQYDDERTSHVK